MCKLYCNGRSCFHERFSKPNKPTDKLNNTAQGLLQIFPLSKNESNEE